MRSLACGVTLVLKFALSPHFWSARKIHPGQKIHSSLVLADTEYLPGYLPKARPPPKETNKQSNEDNEHENAVSGVLDPESLQDGSHCFQLFSRHRRTRLGEREFWVKLRENGLENSEGWLEIDLPGYAKLLLQRRIDDRGGNEALSEIVKKCKFHSVGTRLSADSFCRPDPQSGVQAIYDQAIDTVRLWEEHRPSLEAQQRLIDTAVDILKQHLKNLKLQSFGGTSKFLTNLFSDSTSAEHRQLVKGFLRQFALGE